MRKAVLGGLLTLGLLFGIHQTAGAQQRRAYPRYQLNIQPIPVYSYPVGYGYAYRPGWQYSVGPNYVLPGTGYIYYSRPVYYYGSGYVISR